MPLIDANGRLLGRFNLIDVAIAAFVILLIPIGLVTYRVFRVPDIEIASVAPQSVLPGMDRRITLTGRNFRPYLRVQFTRTGRPNGVENDSAVETEGSLLMASPEQVEIRLPELQPGTYDLQLLDEGQQVAARSSAFTITAGPVMTVEAVVRFVVSPDLAAVVAAGDEDTYQPPGPPIPSDQARAALGAVTRVMEAPAASQLHMSPHLGGFMAVEEPGEVIEAVVTIPAGRGDTGGWEYKKQPIRAGDALRFETPRYAMFGIIRKVTEK